MKKKVPNWTFIFIIVVLIIIIFIAYKNNHKTGTKFTKQSSESHVCGLDCGASDPVMDPLYNIKQIIENILLLEEHLVNERQFCIDCIVKHYLLCTGLYDEAIWLAGKNVSKYPNMTEDAKFMNESFRYWLDNKDDKEIKLEIADQLRQKRKELVHEYVLNEKNIKEKLNN
jgi:hypothetical protein